MTKEELEGYLARGLSLDRIGELTGRHPSTVSYHLKKHGLRAANHAKNAPRGLAFRKEQLEQLLASHASLREMGEELGVSISTVRYWLDKHSLGPSGVGRSRAESAAAREAGETEITKRCPRHGPTRFVLERRGYFRCLKCRTAAVSERRRRAKRQLVTAARGRCAICGYDRYQGALQFHHIDPSTKEFVISRTVTRAFDEMQAEAEKCVLLCANCHAEVEAGIATPPRQLSLQ